MAATGKNEKANASNSEKGCESKLAKCESYKFRLLKIGSFATIFMMSVFLILFLLKAHKSTNRPLRYMTYEGEAERNVASDTGEYSLYFEKVGGNQAELVNEINNEKPIVLKFFEDAGFSKEEISIYDYIHEDFRRPHEEIRYRMGYCVSITTNKLQTILSVRNNLPELYQKGVNLKRQNLTTRSSKLVQVKQELAIEATENAIKNARNLAANIGIRSREILNIQEPYYEINSNTPYGVDVNVVRFDSAPKFHKSAGETSGYNDSQALTQKVKARVKIQLKIK